MASVNAGIYGGGHASSYASANLHAAHGSPVVVASHGGYGYGGHGGYALAGHGLAGHGLGGHGLGGHGLGGHEEHVDYYVSKTF